MSDEEDIYKERQKEKDQLMKFYYDWTRTFDEFRDHAFQTFKYLRLDDTWPHRVLITLLIDHVKLTESKPHFEQVKSYIYSILEEDLFFDYLKNTPESKPTLNNNVIKLVIDNEKTPEKK